MLDEMDRSYWNVLANYIGGKWAAPTHNIVSTGVRVPACRPGPSTFSELQRGTIYDTEVVSVEPYAAVFGGGGIVGLGSKARFKIRYRCHSALYMRSLMHRLTAASLSQLTYYTPSVISDIYGYNKTTGLWTTPPLYVAGQYYYKLDVTDDIDVYVKFPCPFVPSLPFVRTTASTAAYTAYARTGDVKVQTLTSAGINRLGSFHLGSSDPTERAWSTGTSSTDTGSIRIFAITATPLHESLPATTEAYAAVTYTAPVFDNCVVMRFTKDAADAQFWVYAGEDNTYDSMEFYTTGPVLAHTPTTSPMVTNARIIGWEGGWSMGFPTLDVHGEGEVYMA